MDVYSLAADATSRHDGLGRTTKEPRPVRVGAPQVPAFNPGVRNRQGCNCAWQSAENEVETLFISGGYEKAPALGEAGA